MTSDEKIVAGCIIGFIAIVVIINVIQFLHEKIGFFLLLIIYSPIAFFIVTSIDSIGGIIFLIIASFCLVGGIYGGIVLTEEEKEEYEQKRLQKEADKKEQKRLKKERWQTKKCAWCGCTFHWAESGCRWHCCRRCEAQDRG